MAGHSLTVMLIYQQHAQLLVKATGLHHHRDLDLRVRAWLLLQGWQGHVEADQLLTSEPTAALSPCKPGMQHEKKAVQIQANLPHTPSKGQEPIRSWSIAA